MTGQLWWHAYTGLEPEMSKDDDGNRSHAFGLTIFGETPKGPDEMPDALERPCFVDKTQIVTYTRVASWDHEPTDDEKDALTPEEYREPSSA